MVHDGMKCLVSTVLCVKILTKMQLFVQANIYAIWMTENRGMMVR